MSNHTVAQPTWKIDGLFNISYRIGITIQSDMKLGDGIRTFNVFPTSYASVKISAEGIYDAKTGDLCMVGCRTIGSSEQFSATNSMDCEVVANFQFPPSSSKNGGYVKGSIKSARKKKSDPLYFDLFNLASAAYSTVEAKRFIWRLDVEIIMVLLSNTLSCVFLVFQLFHVHKHRDVLPFISLVMLFVTTLGHMIPLILNFEALFFKTYNQQNVLIGTGGWLEVSEVTVRQVTMVAFLLQFRLLQLTSSAKSGHENQKDLWVAERKTPIVPLRVYVIGALVALLVNWTRNRHLFWDDFKSYAGFVMDGFLLPQIIFSMFGNSKQNALSGALYFRTSFLRLVPHWYDIYRTHSHIHNFSKSYIYANPGADFYSTAWDVIILLACMLFALIVYFQQLLGGRCIVPHRFRELEPYEKVPVVSET